MDNENPIETRLSVQGAASVLYTMCTERAADLIRFWEGLDGTDVKEILEGIKGGVDIVGEAFTVIEVIKKVHDLPTRLFMRKFEAYCKGLRDIPQEKREAYLQKVDRTARHQDALFILNVINKIEETEKVEMMVKLFGAKLNEEIDDTAYRRLVIMAGATLHSDLLYMGNHITHDNFPLEEDAQEGLLGSGWIRGVGQGWGELGKSESTNLFAYSIFAKRFCRIVFGKDIEDTPPSDVGTLQAITEGEIDSIFTSSR